MSAMLLGRPAPVPAADPRQATLFAARAALKRALAVRRDAELQVEQLRELVARLDAEMRPAR